MIMNQLWEQYVFLNIARDVQNSVFVLTTSVLNVKYYNNDNLVHFLHALKPKYKVLTDLEGEHFFYYEHAGVHAHTMEVYSWRNTDKS